MAPEAGFRPPPLLARAHVQSVLASLKLRRPFVWRRARSLLQRTRPHLVDCGKGVRLQAWRAVQKGPAKGLAVLIHGWEGSMDSLYLVSAAGCLWRRGWDVVRLNLRDHGPTHHLNRELFHSCRIREVTAAVAEIQSRFERGGRTVLGGFSLGGNFALRVAVRSHRVPMTLAQVVAVSPVLHPPHTIRALETGWWLYRTYFLSKWRRSLALKRRHFPDLFDPAAVARCRTLTELTRYFVAHHTPYDSMNDYLEGYSIIGPALAPLAVPATVLFSRDDPVNPSSDLKHLAPSPRLTVETTTLGGHNGFLRDWRLNSWAETRMADIFDADIPKGAAPRETA
jgi:predicted alpha/beta-fold hydrolase